MNPPLGTVYEEWELLGIVREADSIHDAKVAATLLSLLRRMEELERRLAALDGPLEPRV